MTKSPFDKRTQWEAEALDYAKAQGWEVRITEYGAEFYDEGEFETDYWDYSEEGAEEKVRY